MPPFSGTSALEIIQHVITSEPPRPRDRHPAVDRDLETICLKCLAKVPKERYPSAREVAEDLQRWLDGRPILARPASRIERAAKWVRRRKLVAALSGIAVIGTILGVAGLAWGWTAAVAARDRAREGEDSALRLAYASSINLAERDWRDANVAQVLRHLDETRPTAGQADLRGFEWYYLNRLCHAQERVLTGKENFTSVAYSPDGKLLAGASWDHTITLWDAATGRVVRRLTAEAPVRVVAFHPGGKTLASGGNDGLVTIWDVATGQPLHKMPGHKGPVLRLAYSTDGRVLATSGTTADKLLIWNPGAGLRSPTRDIPSSEFVFGPDDRTIVAVSSDQKKVQAWDVATGDPTGTIVEASASAPAAIGTIAITRDRKLLAVGRDDGTMQLVEVAGGRLVQSLRDQRHPVPISFLEFSQDGRGLASAGQLSPAVLVWEVPTGHLLRSFHGHTIAPQSIALSPDHVHLACAGNNASVQVWDVTHDQESRSLVQEGRVYSVAFAPDSSYLAAALGNGKVVLHDAETGQVLRTLEGHKGTVLSVAIDGNGRRTVTGGVDQTVRIWDLATGRQLRSLGGKDDAVNVVAFGPDGKTVASAHRNRTVRLWDVESGRELHKIEGHISPVLTLAFTPDGQSLATGAGDDFILTWDVKTGRRRATIPAGSKGVVGLAIDPDGRWIASGGGDRSIKLWNLADGRLIRTLSGHSTDPAALRFSPDGAGWSRSATTGRSGSGTRRPAAGSWCCTGTPASSMTWPFRGTAGGSPRPARTTASGSGRPKPPPRPTRPAECASSGSGEARIPAPGPRSGAGTSPSARRRAPDHARWKPRPAICYSTSMPDADESEIREQLRRAAAGDEACWQRLLQEHNGRLRRMITVRLDSRLQGRLDPSDVLQETYLEAARQLDEYLSRPGPPFRLWLRGLAGNRLNKLHRRHLGASKRAAGRDVSLDDAVPEASSVVMASYLLGHEDRPSEAARRADLQLRLAEALEQLDPLDREALVLRHFEQLTSAEAGQILGITEAAAGKRYLRASSGSATSWPRCPAGSTPGGPEPPSASPIRRCSHFFSNSLSGVLASGAIGRRTSHARPTNRPGDAAR